MNTFVAEPSVQVNASINGKPVAAEANETRR